MSEWNARDIHGDTKAMQPRIVTATTDSMTITDRVIYADSTSNAIVVTLPSVAAAVGNIYAIHAPVGATNDVSVNELESGSEYTDGDLDAANDVLVVMSVGYKWCTLCAPS